MKVAELSETKTAARRYNAFGPYMRDLYHRPVYKVNVDAGFTCPNRDGSVATGGCIYCNNDSFRPSACTSASSLREQINNGIPYLRSRYGAESFIVYFQPYTNTYAPVDVLERLYREALDSPGVVGLAIGTRPDCVDEEKVALLESLAKDRFILVEYGLQSIHDRTRDDMLAMADELSRLPIEFLKIHQLQVVKDTALAELHAEKPFPTFGYEDYLVMLADFLERLSPDIVLQRLFASAPEDILIAPVWNRTRSEFYRDLDLYLEKRGSRQGEKLKPLQSADCILQNAKCKT